MSLDTLYRPKTFDDVLGQEATITILRRYIATGRALHQSYLFAGPWGGGKTTLARIMARALMCSAPTASGDPCDQCESCKSMLETGTAMDFVEMDAATNSGKADVQKILEDIQYATFAGKRRIYLVDESHALSKEALDALLKPLEENIPGTQDKRLICIFCTTEPEKMKNTIFSRCAPAFMVHPVAPKDIARRLAYVCDQEKYEYDHEMLQVIAELTECHIRDALKAIEGVSLLGSINKENVSKYLKLDLNLLFISILENLGHDLGEALKFAKHALEKSSPATCYERLAHVAMMAYQVGLGAMKSPAYIEKGRLEKLNDIQKQNLLGFAARFSSRPGRPTEAMLLCDLGSLHFSGGKMLGEAPVIMVSPTPIGLPTPPVLQVSTFTPIPTVGINGNIQRPPNGRGAEVRANPKAVREIKPEVAACERKSVAEMDPDTFSSLLAMQIDQYRQEGISGPTGRSNLDNRRT